MARPERTHWLRENAVERSPHRVLVFDTETSPLDPGRPDHQVLRLWAARLVRRHGHQPEQPRTEDYDGHGADQLADLLERQARSGVTTWCFAHNLAFDLTVTDLPQLLAERGWRITEGALTTEQPWARLSRGTRRLVLADSWSWLPTGVEQLGQLVGIRKPLLPKWADPEQAWLRRCRQDVLITATALLQVMDWWDAGAHGNWSITGPATGWSSYRHQRPTPRVLIEPDPAARELEARAVTGGRREARHLGKLPPGLYAELDLLTAHLTAMAELRLPYRRINHFDGLPLDHPTLRSKAMGQLAQVRVRVSTPRYPWDSGAGIFYPVGTFDTVLAGPELRAALARGELLEIGPGWQYATFPHMATWARWIASLLDAEREDVPRTVQLMVKAWSRQVPGKWAGHTSDVLSRTPDPRPGWALETGFLADGRRKADFLRLGGERWTIVRDLWADDAFPAVLAWVQSYTRLALGQLLDALGPALVVANTDGALVDVDAALTLDGLPRLSGRVTVNRKLRALDAWCVGLDPELAPFVVRVKRAALHLEAISPQHVVLDRERRLSGIPRRAVSLGGHRYRFTAWPQLRVQLQRPIPGGYTTERRTVDLSNVPPAGWLWSDGSVTPPVMVDGEVAPLWSSHLGTELPAAARLAPPERQHLVLRRALRSWPEGNPLQEPTGRPTRPESLRVAS